MNTPDSLKKRVKRKRRVEDLEEHEVISFVDDDVEEENVTVTETSSISITSSTSSSPLCQAPVEQPIQMVKAPHPMKGKPSPIAGTKRNDNLIGMQFIRDLEWSFIKKAWYQIKGGLQEVVYNDESTNFQPVVCWQSRTIQPNKSHGYPQTNVMGLKTGRTTRDGEDRPKTLFLTHQISAMYHKLIPSDAELAWLPSPELAHLCHNKLCCRPEHIKVVSHGTNQAQTNCMVWNLAGDQVCHRFHIGDMCLRRNVRAADRV